jgi:hypothetical protein
MGKERPILFSGPMVRAILDGRKTQTRRVVKPQPDFPLLCRILDGTWGECFSGEDWFCPYGQPGDFMWVREKWNVIECFEDGEGGYPFSSIPKTRPAHSCCLYAADRIDDGPWRPSIHMPRWASRILLRIKSVRVERLQEITEEGAIAEGVERDSDTGLWKNHDSKTSLGWIAVDDPLMSFRTLWYSVNGIESWDANPYVWVVEFERVAESEVAK